MNFMFHVVLTCVIIYFYFINIISSQCWISQGYWTNFSVQHEYDPVNLLTLPLLLLLSLCLLMKLFYFYFFYKANHVSGITLILHLDHPGINVLNPCWMNK